jgi:hypothetical protein
VVWPEGLRVRRGHPRHRDPAGLAPGVGDTRFAPLEGTAHTYAATSSFAALLESPFHETAPPWLPQAPLPRRAEAEVALTAGLRLMDLRDAELARPGLARGHLVATTAAHYPCTRRWAGQLHGRRIGGQPVCGLVWQSRQGPPGPRSAMSGLDPVNDLTYA